MDNPNESVGNWKPILALIIFLTANIIVIFPLKIPLPFFARKFPLNFATAPLLGVLILLATTAINGEIVKKGILGSDGIKPIDIMALFISLAYIAISLDATGLLRFLAFWLVSRSTSGGRRLYLYLYLFFFLSGVIVGNDPVILSGTAFLAYMTRVAGIVPPTAWIFAQFSAANIASTVLVSSNPTNLVLSGAFSLSFVTYSLNVILPSITSALLLFPFLLYILFPSSTLIPRHIHVAGLENPSAALVDRAGAIFGTTLLVVTLAVLLATSAAGLHVEVWTITFPAAIVMLGRDMWHDVNTTRRLKASTLQQNNRPSTGTDGITNGETENISSSHLTQSRRMNEQPIELPQLNDRLSSTSPPPPRPPTIVTSIQRSLTHLTKSFPTVTTVASRLPLALLPFAFSMFILVQALGSSWITVFTKWWVAWVTRTGTVGAVFGSYVITVLACNFCGTNIGATILLARVFQLWIHTHSPSSVTSKGAIYGLALGSNYGAFSASFSASLAGLLWKGILEQKGIFVKQSEFAKLNLGINVVAMIGGCSILIAQLYIRG